MKYLPFLLLVFSLHTSAQNCDETSVAQIPGEWKEGVKAYPKAPSKELANEKNTISTIHNMLKTKYKPIGGEISYNGVYSIPVNFGYSLFFLQYYCNGKNISTSKETSSHLSIYANLFDSEIYDTAQGDRSIMEGFNVMYQMPVAKDGYWYFEEKNEPLGFGITGKRSMWLITHEGKLPYSYVTRKEFLEKRKRSLLIQMNSSASGMKDVLKNIEIQKKYKEEEFKNDPAKLARYLKMDYTQIKERYEKLLAANENDFRPAFAKIDNQLMASEAELSQPAIIKNDPQDHLSYLFTDKDDPFCKILIKPNPGYFSKKLPASAAQFFWVYVSGNHNNPVAAKFMQDIAGALDFDLLKKLLGTVPVKNENIKKITTPGK